MLNVLNSVSVRDDSKPTKKLTVSRLWLSHSGRSCVEDRLERNEQRRNTDAEGEKMTKSAPESSSAAGGGTLHRCADN